MTATENNDDQFSDEIESYDVVFDSISVRQIRESLGMTQFEFASRFGVSVGSVRNWEQGRSEPDASIRSYLIVIKNNPSMVVEALEKERRERRINLVTH